MQLRGIFPIIATPFDEAGRIDESGLRAVVRFCVEGGAHGVVWPAVASEFYTLGEAERKQFLRVVIDEVAGRVPVIASTPAPSGPVAAELTQDAVQAGAAAIMALPPYVVKDNPTRLAAYYQAIGSAAAGRPVILQNAPLPLGQSLSPAAVAQLVGEAPAVRYIKEENLPSGHAVRAILSACGGKLDGVFGGAGGRYLVEEYRRGVCGAMPACEYTDVFATLWNHLEADREEEARSLFERLLPLLMMQATLRMAFTKEVLRRRGIISCTHLRVAGNMNLDETDLDELTQLSDRLEAAFPRS